jgi:cell division protein ZipA
MEQTIRLILLGVGAVVILWILYDGLRRQRKRKNKQAILNGENFEPKLEDIEFESEIALEVDSVIEPEAQEPEEQNCEAEDDIISVIIVPEKGKSFAGDTLLQALFSHDLHYGDMQIFHYYSPNAVNTNKPLFSISAASEPGDFDISTMQENSYPGLIAFMQPAEHFHSAEAFDSMIETVNNLAIDLSGFLLTQDQKLWSDEAAAQIRAEL